MELPAVPAWVRRRDVTPGTAAGEARLDSAGGASSSRQDAPRTGRQVGRQVGRQAGRRAGAADGAAEHTGEVGIPRTADEAVALLYGTHWHQLVRLATLLTRDASMAEELVQDAFVSLHRRWAGLSDPGAAHGYLRTTVVNNARSALRHRSVEERYRQPGPPEPAGPEERAVQATEDLRVMAALRGLSRRQQEVLVLRYYADLSEQDIASTLGLTKGAVKSHAHRGLAALRAALAAPGGGSA